jgi:hypothetical protein
MTQRNPTRPRLRRWLYGRRDLTSVGIAVLSLAPGACLPDISHLSESQNETPGGVLPAAASGTADGMSGAAGSTTGGAGSTSGAASSATGGHAYASGGAPPAGANAGAPGSGGASGGTANGGSPATNASGGQSGTLPVGMDLPVFGNGAPPAAHCSDHAISPRSSWNVSASSDDEANGGVPANLLDDQATRWSSGKPQSGDEWLQVDFGSTVTLNQLNLQQGVYGNDYPRSYTLIVSDTALDFGGAVAAQGDGQSGVSTTIALASPSSGRYLLLKQLGSSLSWWSAEEIEVSCFE